MWSFGLCFLFLVVCFMFVFFKQKTAYEMRISDWSSDVCSSDLDCIESTVAALRREGTGTTGSRIANGTYSSHRALENEIAGFLGRRSAMVFPTGYQANLGVIAGLAGPKDTILLDSDSHEIGRAHV